MIDVRRIGRIFLGALVLMSFLTSGAVIILKLRTLDGRWNRLDGVTDAGTYWRLVSSREGLLAAWAWPWPRERFVSWMLAGDDPERQFPWRGEPTEYYWMVEDGPPPPNQRERGPILHRGRGYVYVGGAPLGRPNWVRLRAPHGVVAAVTALPFAAWAATNVLRWDRTRRRRRLGLCLRCGYDLRESRDRCPECGARSEGTTP
jgi:hypothetical protein